MHEIFRVTRRGFGEKHASFHIGNWLLAILIAILLYLGSCFAKGAYDLLKQRIWADKKAAENAIREDERKKVEERASKDNKESAEIIRNLEELKKTLQDEARRLREGISAHRSDATVEREAIQSLQVSVSKIDGLLQRANTTAPCCSSQKIYLTPDTSPGAPATAKPDQTGSNPSSGTP